LVYLLGRLKKRKWKKAKMTKKTEDWKNYKTTEKNVKREIEKAHREYTDKFLNLNAADFTRASLNSFQIVSVSLVR
jgi:hypothetical protein